MSSPWTRTISATQRAAQRTNASKPRPGRSPGGTCRQPKRQLNTNSVAPAPVDNDLLTSELIEAGQCVYSHTLPVEDDDARTRITNMAAEELLDADKILDNDGVPVIASKSAILQDMIGAVFTSYDDGTLPDVMTLRSVRVGQLVKKKNPDVSLRPEPKDTIAFAGSDEFEEYDVVEEKGKKKTTTRYVQSPAELGGWHAEVVLDRWLKFKISIEFEVKLVYGEGEEIIAAKFTCAMRTKEHMYNDECKKEQCVSLQIGYYDVNDQFAPRDADNLMFFRNKNTNLFNPYAWFVTEEEEQYDFVNDEEEESLRYTFENVNDVLKVVTERNDITVKTAVTDFAITGVPRQYVFDDESMHTLYEFVCEQKLRGNGPTLVIEANDSNRKPKLDGYGRLIVHALIDTDILHNTTDVRAQFHSACNYLHAVHFTVDMLNEFIRQAHDQQKPEIKHMINKWGRQEDGCFLMDNCCFKDGEITSIADANYNIYHRYFTHNQFVPMPKSDFPRILICPVPHVRYMIFCTMWNKLMKPYFVNNELPAKGVLSAALLGLHCHEFWSMTANLKGVPTLWAVSREAGSGKTESFILAQNMLGIGNRAIWGGDATKPATFDACVMDSGLTKFIDDYVPQVGRSGPESIDLAQTVRGFFDGVGRQVCGKPKRAPNCALAYSSNEKVNRGDHPFQSRLITLDFKALDVGLEENYDPKEFACCRTLMSAILPDLEQIGKWNGKIDVDAITDIATWLSKLQKVKRSRPVNNTAKLAFIELNLIKCAGGGYEETVDFLNWIVNDVTKTVCELNMHTSIIDQFILSIIEIRDKIGGNLLNSSPDRLIFWHNFRTEALPNNFVGMPNQPDHRGFWSVRIGPLVHVIKNVLGRTFSEDELYKAVKNHEHALEAQRIEFADTAKQWPLKKQIVCQITGNLVDQPLQESELLSDNMSRYRCAMFNQTYIDTVYSSLTGSQSDVAELKSLTIKSANKSAGTYNFFEQVTSGGWFGYRTLKQSTFGTFCGATNKIYCGNTKLLIDCKIEDETRAAGFESVMSCFEPRFILDQISYSMPTVEDIEKYPPCWMKMPFGTRDHDGDEAIVDPQDFGQVVGAYSNKGEFRRFTTEVYDPTEFDPYDASDDAPHTYEESRQPKRQRCESYIETRQPKIARRASKTNLSRYPRPPRNLDTLDGAIAYERYLLAGGTPIVDEEAVDLLTPDELVELENAMLMSDDDDEEQPPIMHKCTNVLDYDEELGEILCNAPISESEQMCRFCVNLGHRETGLLP